MSIKKSWSIIFVAVLGCTVSLPLAQASDANEQTEITFNQPVEIPGLVLPAGSYWFVRDPSVIDVVRILSLDWKTLYATKITVSAQRLQPAIDTIITFAERPSSKPEALLKWFYPGQTIGHEFLYPNKEEREFAPDQHQVVVAAPMENQVRAGF